MTGAARGGLRVGGSFTTAAGEAAVATEAWEAVAADGKQRLRAHGEIREGRSRRWNLEATLTAGGLVESLEWQLTPEPPPTEVTTIALRSHGDKVFITRIPPGGVPERLETGFAPGSLIVGPSLALLALLAARVSVQAGMGRRALFVRVDDRDLSVRLEDGIILHGGRVRGPGSQGREGWLRTVELRTAADAGRAESLLTFDAGNDLLEARWPRTLPPRAARTG